MDSYENELNNLHPAAISSFQDRKKGNSRDGNDLARLGKRAVLKRNFGFMSILGFSCTVLVTWEGALILFISGFENGGPAGIIYGFIVVWVGTLSVFVTLAELASMAPTSGGQYHWVSMLAPARAQTFISYITGWVTVAGWQAAVASGAFLTGTLLQGLVVLTNPSYQPRSWEGTLICWAVVMFCVLINTVLISLLPKFEGAILVLHILGFFAILIPLTILGPHDTATDVFKTFLNEGGWQTQGLSFFVGLLGNVFAFVGADGAIHMSEEIQNASLVVPRSIVLSILINGVMGFSMLIATLFCIGDLNAALSSPTGYPFMEIISQAIHTTSGTAVLVALVFVLALCATVGLLASSSRMIWAFSRDRGLPGWKVLSRVERRTSVPVYSVLVTTAIACLLAIINIGSTAAFQNIISLCVSGLFLSYLIVASLLLYRRCTHGIKEVSISDISPNRAIVNTSGSSLVWGPWRIPGVLGIINNTFACVYLILILIFSFFPSSTPVGPANMNYSILVTGAVVLFSIFYYVIWAKKVYSGPIVEM